MWPVPTLGLHSMANPTLSHRFRVKYQVWSKGGSIKYKDTQEIPKIKRLPSGNWGQPSDFALDRPHCLLYTDPNHIFLNCFSSTPLPSHHPVLLTLRPHKVIGSGVIVPHKRKKKKSKGREGREIGEN